MTAGTALPRNNAQVVKASLNCDDRLLCHANRICHKSLFFEQNALSDSEPIRYPSVATIGR